MLLAVLSRCRLTVSETDSKEMLMPIDRLALLDDQAEPHVVELIPGEHYVVFFGTGDTVLPSEEGIEELRVLAYARRNKETLGTTGIQVAETLAEVVAAGVATNAIWVQCQAAARYVKQRRAASQARSLNGPDESPGARSRPFRPPGFPYLMLLLPRASWFLHPWASGHGKFPVP
jgi:hypothetical protein